jgi:hypothetical protein
MLEVEIPTNKSRWMLGFGVLAVTGLVGLESFAHKESEER